MYARLPKYVPLFLVLALAVTACSDDNGGASPTAPDPVASAKITAEPSIVSPEFIAGPFCRGFRPFGARLVFVVRPTSDLFLRSLRVHFVDRFGVRTAPTVIPLQTITSAAPSIPTGTTIPIPTSSPVPIPGSSPVPTPGVAEFDPLLIFGGSARTLPFFLRFGCGIPADGTVFFDFDLSDRHGRRSTSHVRARIGG